MATLFFENVTIGDALPVLTKGPITLTDLVKYSGASGDFNPLHTVPEYAKQQAGLPDVIAHGMLSMAFAGQLVTDWIGSAGEVKRLKAQFRAMTFLGDTVRCEGIIADKRQTADGNLVDVNIVLTAGRDGRKTILGQATVALPSKAKKGTRGSAATTPKPQAPKKTAATPAKRKAAKKKAAKKSPAKKAGAKKAPVKKKAGKKKK